MISTAGIIYNIDIFPTIKFAVSSISLIIFVLRSINNNIIPIILTGNLLCISTDNISDTTVTEKIIVIWFMYFIVIPPSYLFFISPFFNNRC